MFQLIARYSSSSQTWGLEVENGYHNHPPAMHLEGHAFAQRLTEEEMEYVLEQTRLHLKPYQILAGIKDKFPGNVSSIKTIQNAVAKIRRENNFGHTPMQNLFNKLQTLQFSYETRTDPENHVDQIFWMHPTSDTLWRAFPHVLIIDPTYTTNMYKLPCVQIVGMTSSDKTFSIAHAFINRERVDDFVWVLECLKSRLEHCMEPRVILTDRDLALMNACGKVFPEAVHQLCRYHIGENIRTRYQKSFDDEDEWDKFSYMWRRVVESETEDDYVYNFNRLATSFNETHRGKLSPYNVNPCFFFYL
jgi:histone-lysine N-methyltransferase SETD2